MDVPYKTMSMSVVLFLTRLLDGISISSNVNMHVLFNRNNDYSEYVGCNEHPTIDTVNYF